MESIREGNWCHRRGTSFLTLVSVQKLLFFVSSSRTHRRTHAHTHTHLCVAGVQNRSLLQSLTKMLNRQPSTACSMKSKSNSEFDTVESSAIQYVCSSASLQCTRSLHFPLCLFLPVPVSICLSVSVSPPPSLIGLYRQLMSKVEQLRKRTEQVRLFASSQRAVFVQTTVGGGERQDKGASQLQDIQHTFPYTPCLKTKALEAKRKRAQQQQATLAVGSKDARSSKANSADDDDEDDDDSDDEDWEAVSWRSKAV